MKRKMKKFMALFLILSICFHSASMNVFAKEQTTKWSTEESTVLQTEMADETQTETSTETNTTALENDLVKEIPEGAWDGVTTESVYENENYKITFLLTGHWEGGYSAKVKIENTGDSVIENWSLGFKHQGKISELSNAVIDSQKEGKYIIKNCGWNQDIPVGGNVEFSFCGQESFYDFPKQYDLLGNIVCVNEEDYSIKYQLTDDWGNGFSGSISITNNTDTALEDWVLEFDFDRKITKVWDGVIDSQEENHYTIRNAGHNSHIASGATVSFGISGIEGVKTDEPSGYKLYSYNNLTVDLTIDTDNDGAPDYVEDYFGTDKRKTDTDGDGLSDYIELFSIVLDPLCADTDNDGIDDGMEDTDADGLLNLEEVEIGTSILKQDTDNDGLSDYVEVNDYKTNPKLFDTDADGVSDGKEIEIGSNPLVYEKTFHINVEANNKDTVKVSVETTLSGEQVETLSVKKYEDEFSFPKTMPGYIGGAYDFYVDGSFESAKIKFEFDEALLKDKTFDPVIYYFNEETQLLEEMDTTVVGNTAITEVTHFSKYILLNRTVFQKAFEWQDVWSTNGYSGVEVVLVIDDSGSMSSNDRNNQRLIVAKNLIDNLPVNSKVGVVKFANSTSKLTPKLTDDKETAKSYLTTSNFRAYGGTYMYYAINSAFTLFETSDENILKMMVVLSDGATSDTSLHSSIIKSANNANVKVYTVGLGSSNSNYFTNYLKPLANNTAGAFYLASNANQLEEIYNDINRKIDIETDSDMDGIADYYEENMVMFNGMTIKLDKNNPDSDGDGLKDGEEVAELNYQYNEDKTKVIVTGKLLSNPLNMDTDGDGISDDEEMLIGTDPKLFDTDGDGLSDGVELTNWFDPLDKDPDGDGRYDLQEYQEGTDPFVYNKEWYEHVWDFVCGFVAGDFIADTDSLPTIIGQVSSSFIPFVDIRDVIGNLANGDYAFAGLSALGLVPAAGDAAKTAGKVGKFVLKNVDDIPKIAGLLEFLSKNFPDAVKALSKSDDFVDAAKMLSKADNIKLTRKQAKVITEAFENAGLSHYLIKTSNSLDLKDTLNIGTEVWEQGAIKRGNIIDEFLNGHLAGTGLGKNFPVADRLLKDERILVSTKSLDVAAQSYQNPSKLKNILNKYADSLKNIEKNYFDDGILEWGETVLSTSQYDKKALEIVLPDVIISEDTLKVLNEFKTTMEEEGMQVWYRIVK